MGKNQLISGKRAKTFIYALAIFLVLCTSALMPVEMTPSFTFCLFKNITGRPCPSCGMGRGFVLMGDLNIKKALEFNIISPMIYLAAFLVMLLLVNDLIFDTDKIHRYLNKHKKAILIIIISMAVLSWMNNLFFNPHFK
jgi:hypothetical protein